MTIIKKFHTKKRLEFHLFGAALSKIALVLIRTLILALIIVSIVSCNAAKQDRALTVTFETNGGLTLVSQSIGYGSKAIKPADPIKADQSFAGWYKDADFISPFSFESEVITANTTIYAKWNINIAFAKVASGEGHSIALTKTGELYAWGYNKYGQLGDGTTTTRLSPTKINIPNNTDTITFTQISAGMKHSLALTSAGELYAWGDNSYSQLGNETLTEILVPTKIDTGTIKLSQIIAGRETSLALSRAGEIYVWGFFGNVQTVESPTNNNTSSKNGSVPTKIKSNISFSKIALGYSHYLALSKTGELYAWGMGDGTTTDRQVPTKLNTKGITFTQIAAGLRHSVALSSTGELYAWGDDNQYGQLGNGTNTILNIPTKISTTIFTQIAANNYHNVALTSTGELYTWGNNLFGQLGDGSFTDKMIPTRVNSSISFSQIAAGASNNLALTSTGALYAWGLNDKGQFGNGTSSNRTSPFKIGTTRFAKIAAGIGHALALTSTGQLYAWGYNARGELGDGTKIHRNTPTQIGASFDFAQIAAGNGYSLALTRKGELYAWGIYNDGETEFSSSLKATPTKIDVKDTTKDNAKNSTGTVTFTQIVAGTYHCLALTDKGDLYAWGARNSEGQIGDGTNSIRLAPTKINALKNTSGITFTKIAAGANHSIALTSKGDLFAWGSNDYGQLGDGTSENKNIPTKINTNGISFKQISAGLNYSLALTSTGELYAWGYIGQQGNTTEPESKTPIKIGTTKFAQFSAGAYHSMALTSSGELYTWGSNDDGQLGDGTTTDNFYPTKIGTINFAQISASYDFSLALTSTGDLYAWGWNMFGQLGDGQTNNKNTPILISQRP